MSVNRFVSMPLWLKLALLAGSGVLSTLLMAGIGLTALVRVGGAEVELAEDALPSKDIISEINDIVDNFRISELRLALLSAEDAKREEAALQQLAGELPVQLKDYRTRIDDDTERRLVEQLEAALGKYTSAATGRIEQLRNGDAASRTESAKSIATEGASQFRDVGDRIDALAKFNTDSVKVAHQEATAADKASRIEMGVALLVAIVLVGTLAATLSRHLLRQLGGEPANASEFARQVAQGNLAYRVVLRPGDERSLMGSLKEMQSRLSTIVAGVRERAEQVSVASGEIAQGNADLSSRTEQQASALQETSSSMEELGATVRQNADNAQTAHRLASQASEAAKHGGQVVTQVVSTMGQITGSSQRIADIIGVIDGIAFQTNILALNAAVEAARAGEQGRGFAVVAGEVRALAQRSATAAREIKTLIGTSVEQVQTGAALVNEAGSNMDRIVSEIQRLASIVEAISTASREQSAGVSQVGLAITQMDQATQQNAALVEESAAAADSLRQQSQALVESVAVFRLNES